MTGSFMLNLAGHSDFVTTCSYSPDGKYIVSGSKDKTLKLWDAATGKELATLTGHSNVVMACCYSPDGKSIVSGSDDKTLKLWDAVTGKELATLVGHSQDVNACSYSPDGKHIVSASADQTIKLWDAKTGKELATLVGHTKNVHACSYSPDGKYIVSAGADQTIKLWDAKTKKELATLVGHSDGVNACSYSPDGKRIVSASYDETLKLWDAMSGMEIATLKGHRGFVMACSYSPDGKQIVSASDDNFLIIWDALTGREKSTLLGHEDSVESCAFSPDGTRIVSASKDKTLKIWDAHINIRLNASEVECRKEAKTTYGGLSFAKNCGGRDWRDKPSSTNTLHPALPYDSQPKKYLKEIISFAKDPGVDENDYNSIAEALLPRRLISGSKNERSQNLEYNKDTVDCTVFSPPSVTPGDSFLIQVYAHLMEKADEAAEMAREFDDKAVRRGFTSLETEIERGSKLSVFLQIKDIVIDEPVQVLTWRGRTASVGFEAAIPANYKIGGLIGKVTVSQDSIPIGHIRFKMEVAAQSKSDFHADKAVPVGEAKRYNYAFISYASKDRDEVLRRVQMLNAMNIQFFQDIMNLEPGVAWEKELYRQIDLADVFYLFWSRSAKESEWVKKEINYALLRKQGSDENPPVILPVIIEGPPCPEPPPELSHIHFNDKVLYFIEFDKGQTSGLNNTYEADKKPILKNTPSSPQPEIKLAAPFQVEFWFKIIKCAKEGYGLEIKCKYCEYEGSYDPRDGDRPESNCPKCGK